MILLGVIDPDSENVDMVELLEIEALLMEGCNGRETTKPRVAKPCLRAYSTRPASTSAIMTDVQPDCSAMAAVRRPTVPAPMTSAVEPGDGFARFTAWMPTERGSSRAAASKET